MLKKIVITLVCTGALVSASCAINAATAKAASKTFKAPMSFSKSMNLRKSPAIRAFKATRPPVRMSNIRRFKPKLSRSKSMLHRARIDRRELAAQALSRIRFRRQSKKFAIGRSKNMQNILQASRLEKAPGLAIGRNSDLVKTLRNSNKFGYGGTYRTDRGPLQYFGDRANRPATLSPFNQQHLGAPWLRNVPASSWSKSIHSSNLAISRLNTDLATLRATFSTSNTSAKVSASGTAYRGVPE